MDKIPFSAYDFFGYLSAGAVLLFSVAFAVMGSAALKLQLNAAQMLGLVVASYIAGHVIATISKFLLEQKLANDQLGTPTSLLFGEPAKSEIIRVFPEYGEALPTKTRTRILQRSGQAASIDAPGVALFDHCFCVVRRHDYIRERLGAFLSLYGFSRNVSIAALIGAVVLGVAAASACDQSKLCKQLGAASLIALVVSVSLFFRFLKFYRLYSREVYVAYAEADVGEAPPTPSGTSGQQRNGSEN